MTGAPEQHGGQMTALDFKHEQRWWLFISNEEVFVACFQRHARRKLTLDGPTAEPGGFSRRSGTESTLGGITAASREIVYN